MTVEEVEDVEPGGLPSRPWVGEFPLPAASILGQEKMFFDEIRDRKTATGESDFAPFADRNEWDLASLLVRSGLKQEAINDYLTLPIVSIHSICIQACSTHLSTTSCALLDKNSYLTIIPQQLRLPPED